MIVIHATEALSANVNDTRKKKGSLIARYTDKLQHVLGSKTKPEPWLHAAIMYDRNRSVVIYAIYIWDTRKTIESDAKMATSMKLDAVLNVARQSRAADNGMQISGSKHSEIINVNVFGGDESEKAAASKKVDEQLDKRDARSKLARQSDTNPISRKYQIKRDSRQSDIRLQADADAKTNKIAALAIQLRDYIKSNMPDEKTIMSMYDLTDKDRINSEYYGLASIADKIVDAMTKSAKLENIRSTMYSFAIAISSGLYDVLLTVAKNVKSPVLDYKSSYDADSIMKGFLYSYGEPKDRTEVVFAKLGIKTK